MKTKGGKISGGLEIKINTHAANTNKMTAARFRLVPSCDGRK